MKQKYFLSISLFILTILCSLQTFAQVSITANPASGCRPLPVSFTSTAPGTAANWNWSFGDGASNSTLPNPSHTYTSPGQFYAQLYVYDASFSFLGNTGQWITVSGIADSVNLSSHQVCPGDNVSVCTNTYGNVQITKTAWDFGDGYTTTNTYSCTSHTYTTPGTYTIEVVATTNCGTDTAWGIINVNSNAQITNTPYFQLASDSLCPGDAATFYTDWNYQNYALDFGDGNTVTHTPNVNGNNTQVTHVYPTIGTYPIKITYFNSCGNSKVMLDTIRVSTHHLVGGYISIQINYGQHYDTACINSYVQLYPNGPAFSSYKWNFGGGVNDTSTQETPTHKYSSLGKFTVQLTVTNGCGNSKTVTDTVRIVNTLPFGGLGSSITPDTICPGQAVHYYAYPNSGGGNDPSLTYIWNFGDGTGATGSQGTHNMPNVGTYTYSCVGQNSCGSKDSLTHIVLVSPTAVPDKRNYQYEATATSRAACPGDSILFIFGPAGNGTVHWDFGDATNANATQSLTFQNAVYRFAKHAYTLTGHFVATVTYTNSCGNFFNDTLGVNINPHASDFGNGNGNIIIYDNTVYPCQGAPITFYALQGSTYIWNFGDGTGNVVTHQSLSPVNHVFQNSGKYLVTCKAINGCGFSGNDSVTVDIPASLIKITTNSVNAHCHQSNGKAIAVISGGTAPYSYQWSNGKSQYIDDSIPSGIYVINVTDIKGCTNFKIATVNDAEAPTITVGTVVNVSCYGGNDGAISINLIGSSSPYTYNWSTGATSQNINNQVAGPKELTVTDANGCTSSKSILIGESPPVSVSIVVHSATCGVSDGSATAAVNGTTGPYSYIWSNSANTQVNAGIAPGNYTVTVVDNNGCLFYADATVSNVNGPYIYQDSILGTGCGNALTQIYTHAAGGTAPYTYSWSTGATTPALTNGGVGNYILTVSGHNGCKSVQSFDITHDMPAGLPICLITVDTATNTNQMNWNNPVSTDIARYNIYKESSQNGLYYLVDTVNYHHMSQWTDPNANPQVRSWKYRLSVVDQCGDESPQSAEHKTIHLNINSGLGGAYNLIWDEYIGFAYSTYIISRYTIAGGWVQIATVPANVLSYTDASPPANTYSYKVEAVASYNCTPSTRAQINTSRSNIKTVSASPLEVQEMIQPYAFTLFPNPNDGHFTVGYPYSQDGYVIHVYNVVGQEVYSSRIAAAEAAQSINSKEVSLDALPAGIYTLSFNGSNGKVIKKVIVR